MGETGHRTEFEPATLFQHDRGTLIRNDRLWRVHNGLQHTFEIQSGGDFAADGIQRFEDFYLAFRDEQARVMQCIRCRVVQTT